MKSIWTETHRPTALEEMALPEETKSFLLKMLQRKGILPNLLLHGPPGSGKTSLSLILSKHYATPQDLLELNASSDREISVIRGKIKDFASTKSSLNRTKIVIMDECDYLTVDAQHCLRRVIEDTQKNTRFIFITNYISKVIDPIKSRLSLIYIPYSQKENSLIILQKIKEKENLNILTNELLFLLDATEGDMRKSITILQSTAMYDHPNEHRRIISELTGTIPVELTQRIFKVSTVAEILEEGKLLVREGYSVSSIIKELSKKASLLPSSLKLLSFLQNLSRIEEETLHGALDALQIFAVLSEVALFSPSRLP
ncbi:replication factor C subunit 2/4 [Nematocida sp. LUAm3]|nr:replication factor C subunit 2/4 [Nematocida sp. LUAm3]KAI5175158.1 replication factor C subunit 2/4 [Nematocida sp. LUAm2]KAI5178170.1 replication factor C subunit 2/4 [Nematocida sp. LUAm1]